MRRIPQLLSPRHYAPALVVLVLAVSLILARDRGGGWWVVAIVAGLLCVLGVHDLWQRARAIRRNYPIVGNIRWLVEAIRPDLGPLIIQRLCGPREALRVMTLEGGLEAILGQAVRSDPANRHMIEPDLGRRIIDALQQAARPLIAEGKPFAMVVQPAVRLAVRKLVRSSLPDTPVMSFLEVPEDKPVEVVAVIGAPQQLAA